MIFHNLLLGHFIEELTIESNENDFVFLRRYKDERYKKYLFVSPTGDIQLHVCLYLNIEFYLSYQIRVITKMTSMIVLTISKPPMMCTC